MYSVGGLFSGIGGIELGLERTGGFKTAWHCEVDPWCQKILKKHWPDVPCYGDIRELKGDEVESVQVLSGGFPCQDISDTGKQAGIEGSRSSLWKEFARLVDELRPQYVIVENVSALRRRGLGVVLGDLADLGYNAEWDCLRASDFGAPHRRERLWLVAHANGFGWNRRPGIFGPKRWEESKDSRERLRQHWSTEPDMGRVAYGVPSQSHRVKGLGNAVVPQVAEWVGEGILAADHV